MMQAWQELCFFVWISAKSITERLILVASDILPLHPNQDGSPPPLPPPSPPPISPRTSMPERDFFGELSHMLWVLGLIFIVLILLSWLSKRFLVNRMSPIRAGGEIQILERRTLSVKSTLYLIEVDDARWLIGESATGLTSFGRLDFPGSTMPRAPSAHSPHSPSIDKKEVD